MALLRHPGKVCEFEAYDTAAVTRVGFGNPNHGPEHPGSGSGLQDAGFRWTVLERHGKRPLAVLGRMLLQASNRCSGLPCWSEIAIHETAAHRFAASVRHQPPDAFGSAWKDTWLCANAEAVATALYAHDPLRALPPDLVLGRSLAADPGDGLALDDGTCRAAAAWRFRGAWAGLLASILGLPVMPRAAE